MTDVQAMIEAFKARGGQITRVETGTTALNLTEREWGQVVRGNKPAALDYEADEHEMETIERNDEKRRQAAFEARLLGHRHI